MTLTADNKGRIACRDLFSPHASFEALKEPDGRVTLIRLRRDERKPRLVKPMVRKGLLVLPMDNAELDSDGHLGFADLEELGLVRFRREPFPDRLPDVG
jgi:hypothetical protein